MGGQNVLPGRVETIAAGLGTLVGEHGERFGLQLNARHALLGQTVYFAVRRDHVRLELTMAGETPPVNSVTGRVRAIEYQGTFVKVTLETTSATAGSQFVAYVEEGSYFRSPIAVGAQVTARWTIGDVHPVTNESK
jgi:ABC-type molybdate transport system ATPase subunit